MRCAAPSHEALALLRHFLGLFLSHRAAQQIGLSQGVARERVGRLHHLFLIDEHAECFLQDLFQFGQFIFDLATSLFALDEIVNHRHRARAIERIERCQMLDRVWLVTPQHIPHPMRFKLEHA